MMIGPMVWIGAVLLVLASVGACVATYAWCRRALAREVAAMRRLLDERLAAVATAMANAAAKNAITVPADAQAVWPAVNGSPVRVRIRKRTPGVVTPEDAAVVAAAALATARTGGTLEPVAVSGTGGSNWAQQGRTLAHAARNVQYRPAPQRAMSLVSHGNGEGRSEAAD